MGKTTGITRHHLVIVVNGLIAIAGLVPREPERTECRRLSQQCTRSRESKRAQQVVQLKTNKYVSLADTSSITTHTYTGMRPGLLTPQVKPEPKHNWLANHRNIHTPRQLHCVDGC